MISFSLYCPNRLLSNVIKKRREWLDHCSSSVSFSFSFGYQEEIYVDWHALMWLLIIERRRISCWSISSRREWSEGKTRRRQLFDWLLKNNDDSLMYWSFFFVDLDVREMSLVECRTNDWILFSNYWWQIKHSFDRIRKQLSGDEELGEFQNDQINIREGGSYLLDIDIVVAVFSSSLPLVKFDPSVLVFFSRWFLRDQT